MLIEISLGNAFIYEFSLSKDQFLQAVRLAVSEQWVTPQQLTEAIQQAAGQEEVARGAAVPFWPALRRGERSHEPTQFFWP